MTRVLQLIEGPLGKEALAAFYTVYNDLGLGFLEGAYANALAVELRYRGLEVEREVPTESSTAVFLSDSIAWTCW